SLARPDSFPTRRSSDLKPKDQHPTSAIQLKGGMLAIANEWDPAKNDFNWRVFGTGDGFTADLLTAGTLNASLVRIRSQITDEERSEEHTSELQSRENLV